MKPSVLLLLLSLSIPALGHHDPEPAAPPEQPQSLAPASFKDQWDQPQQLDAQTRWLVVSRSMGGSDVVKEAFEALEVTKPAQYQLLYLADISGMPGLVSKMIALPAMRDYAFPMALIRQEDRLEAMGLTLQEEDAAWVFALDGLRITASRSFTETAGFQRFLEETVLQTTAAAL